MIGSIGHSSLKATMKEVKCENCGTSEGVKEYGILVTHDIGKIVELCTDCWVIVYECGDTRFNEEGEAILP